MSLICLQVESTPMTWLPLFHVFLKDFFKYFKNWVCSRALILTQFHCCHAQGWPKGSWTPAPGDPESNHIIYRPKHHVKQSWYIRKNRVACIPTLFIIDHWLFPVVSWDFPNVNICQHCPITHEDCSLSNIWLMGFWCDATAMS